MKCKNLAYIYQWWANFLDKAPKTNFFTKLRAKQVSKESYASHIVVVNHYPGKTKGKPTTPIFLFLDIEEVAIGTLATGRHVTWFE